jgi:hypothetical protein
MTLNGFVIRLCCVLFQLPLIPVVAWAQSNIGYEANAYSDAAVARATSSFKFNGNPAANSYGVHWFGVQSFGMNELREMGISTGFNHKKFNSGIEIHHFGFDLFNESRLYSGLSVSLGNHSMGFSLGGVQSNIKGYGRSSGINFGIGFTSIISEYMKMGGAITDILLWNNGDFILDSRYVSQIGFEIALKGSTKVYSALRLIPGYNPSVSLAIESSPLKYIQFVAGYKTELEEWSGGLKLDVNRMIIYLCSRKHPYLGWSPGAGFGIVW